MVSYVPVWWPTKTKTRNNLLTLPLRLLVRNAVAVTTNTSMLVPTAARRVGWLLALKHFAVLLDTVALALRDLELLAVWLALGRCPGEVVATHLNVVVGELAKLVVIHTEKLGLFRRAQVKTGNEVDGVGNESAHAEGPSGRGTDVGNLDVHLLPIVRALYLVTQHQLPAFLYRQI